MDNTRSLTLSPVRRHRSALVALALAASVAMQAGTGRAAALEDEVRAAFERFVSAQNAHDPAAVGALLDERADFLWITRGTAIWGRAGALQRFTMLYEGTWKLDPEWPALRVMPLSADAAHVMVPVVFTTGAAGQPPQSARMYLNQILVRREAGWRITSILPVPALPPQ